MRVAVVLLALLSISTPVAEAKPFERNAAVAWGIAIQYWGEYPHCDVYDVAYAAMDPEFGGEGGHCYMRINENLLGPYHSFQGLCQIIVHEMGHMLGYAHSPNHWDVMYPYSASVPGCAEEDKNRQRRLDVLLEAAYRQIDRARARYWRARKCRHRHRKIINKLKVKIRKLEEASTLDV